MTPALRTLSRCLVCGFAEVRTDEVLDRGLLLLGECPRCEHRWTARLPEGAAPAFGAAPAPSAAARLRARPRPETPAAA